MIVNDFRTSTGSKDDNTSPLFSRISKHSYQSDGSSSESITLEDFKILRFIDKGTFGSVFLAFLPQLGKHFAIKCINKDNLIQGNNIEKARLEKLIMTEI